MKYLTVIWAILILAMSCFPCMDSNEAYAQSPASTVQADELHHQDEQGEDHCAPMCDCNCCGIVKLVFQIKQLEEPQHIQQIPSLSPYVEPGAATPSFPFWHPPRV
jgi:hypothetical protein